jgi:hypothetical protein
VPTRSSSVRPDNLAKICALRYRGYHEDVALLSFSIALTSLRSPVSGGFAVVQPDSALSINAVEAYPLEDFSADVSCGNEQNVLTYFFDRHLSITGCQVPDRRGPEDCQW